MYLIGQVAEALDAAHADHLVHRDIKPSNILVTLSDFVYVVDFGIARSVGGRQTPLTNTGVYIGTLDYMAPERFTGQDVDGRADIYSLACLLHECLTGAPPFNGKDLPALMYAQLYFGPPEASRLVEGVPPALDAVIARGMAKDPEDRFATAGALAAAAREALLAKAPTPQMMELQHTWTGVPDPTSPAATAAAAGPGVAEPPGPEPEPAGNRAAERVPYSPTQTVTADSVDGRGDTRPPDERTAGQKSWIQPVVAYRLAWRQAARRVGPRGAGLACRFWPQPRHWQLRSCSSSLLPLGRNGRRFCHANPGSATETGTAGALSSVPSLAVPTVAGTIQVGKTPNYVQVAPNGKFAYITNSGARAITVLNTANDRVSGTIKIPQGPPESVSFSPDSRTAYVSVYGSHSVPVIAFIDTATSTVTSTVQVDNIQPGPSATSPDGLYLYVPNHNMTQGGTGDNVVDVIDLATRKLIDSIPVEANPHWVAFGKNGLFYVTDHMSAVVTVLNANTNHIIKTIDVGETPHSEALSPDGSRLAVTSYNGDAVFLINTVTDQMIKQIPVGRSRWTSATRQMGATSSR